eukprot:UN25368
MQMSAAPAVSTTHLTKILKIVPQHLIATIFAAENATSIQFQTVAKSPPIVLATMLPLLLGGGCCENCAQCVKDALFERLECGKLYLECLSFSQVVFCDEFTFVLES